MPGNELLVLGNEPGRDRNAGKCMVLNTFKGIRFLQGENKEARKASQYLKSSIGKGLALGNVLKFGF